MWKPDYNKLAY